MLKLAHIALAFTASLALAACQPEAPAPAAAPAAAGQQAAAPTAAADAIASVSNPLINITPASMSACDPAATGTVTWDVRSAHPDTASVNIYAGVGPAAKLFVSGGANGNAQTGPWVRPGSQFQIKDAASGADLGQITVGGPKCS